MKKHNIKNATSMIMAIIVICLSCKREEMSFIGPDPVKESETLKLYFENQQYEPNTKVDISTSTGVASWTSGDQIALCVTNGSSTYYVTKTINTSTNEVDCILPEGYSRVNYAIYPITSQGTNYTLPTVVYPTSYDMSGKNMETYSPMPMVAVNQVGKDLVFYHVGGMLHVLIYDADASTTKVTATFNGISHVTGTYTVSNPGTNNATTTLSSGTGNTITFNSVSPNGDGLIMFNIPIPTGSYSSITSISFRTYNSSNTVLQSFDRTVSWTSMNRAIAKSSSGSATRIWGTFGGVMVAPAPLYYNGSTFVIKDYDWEHNSYNSVYGKTSGSYYFNIVDLGQYFDSSGKSFATGSNINNNGKKVTYLGFNNWRLPTRQEFQKLNGGTRNGSTINGINNCKFANITLTDYTRGVLYAPDDITMTNMTKTLTWNGSTNNTGVTRSELIQYLDMGCVFFPLYGYYDEDGWDWKGSFGKYWTASGSSQYYYSYLYYGNSPSIYTQDPNNTYCLVRLVRDVN